MKQSVHHLIYILIIVSLFCFADWRRTNAFEHGYDRGIQYEQKLTEVCRERIGNSYDDMVYCIEGLYGSEEAETIVNSQYHRPNIAVEFFHWLIR